MHDLNVSLYNEKCPQWTENELYIYDRFKFWTEIVGGISISLLGMCCNALAIIVIILMDKRSNIFNYLLICLLATDFAYLFLVVFYETLDHIITSDRWFNLLYPKVLHMPTDAYKMPTDAYRCLRMPYGARLQRPLWEAAEPL